LLSVLFGRNSGRICCSAKKISAIVTQYFLTAQSQLERTKAANMADDNENTTTVSPQMKEYQEMMRARWNARSEASSGEATPGKLHSIICFKLA
jgi:hypothetical protein